MVKELALHGGKFADILRGGGPARVRVALPRPDAAAGCVDENAIKFSFRRWFGSPFPWHGAEVKNLRARGPFFKFS